MTAIKKLNDRHVASRGAPDLHQTKCSAIVIRRPWWNPIEAHRRDAWTYRDGPIVIERAKGTKAWNTIVDAWGALDPHRRALVEADPGPHCGPICPRFCAIVRLERFVEESTRSRLDHTTIAARLNHDHGSFGEIMAHDHITIGGPRSLCHRGHQSASNRGSNGPNFSGENPL